MRIRHEFDPGYSGWSECNEMFEDRNGFGENCGKPVHNVIHNIGAPYARVIAHGDRHWLIQVMGSDGESVSTAAFVGKHHQALRVAQLRAYEQLRAEVSKSLWR